MRRVASRGEGIGRICGNYIQLGHGQIRLLGKPFYDCINSRQLFPADWLGPIYGQSDLVREKIRNKICSPGYDEAKDHSILSAEILAHSNREKREKRQQKNSFQVVHD